LSCEKKKSKPLIALLHPLLECGKKHSKPAEKGQTVKTHRPGKKGSNQGLKKGNSEGVTKFPYSNWRVGPLDH